MLSWLHILMGCVVMFVVVKNIQKYLLVIFTGLTIGSVAQLLLVYMQFISQSSLQGLWYWMGERQVVLSLPDVAKISVYGREYLRPYGTFSHPNTLGGFYVLLFFFTFWLKQQVSPIDRQAKLMASVILFISPFLILTSFSKVAILSFVLGNLILVWGDYTYRKCTLCLVARTSILILVFLMFTIPIGDPYSLQKRLVLVGNSLQIFFDHPLWGVGIGNYIVAQSSLSIIPRYMPLYQPVHNVFLLMLAELGVGGIMLLYFFVRQLKILMLGGTHLFPIVLVVLLTGMFDHYWVTQPQTQWLLIFVALTVLFANILPAGESKKRPL
jgi:O-antigen ligase